MTKLILDQLRKAEGKPVLVPAITAAIMDAKGLDKTHHDAVRKLPPVCWPSFMVWQNVGKFPGLAVVLELAG